MQERKYAYLLDAAWLRDADEKESPEPIMQSTLDQDAYELVPSLIRLCCASKCSITNNGAHADFLRLTRGPAIFFPGASHVAPHQEKVAIPAEISRHRRANCSPLDGGTHGSLRRGAQAAP